MEALQTNINRINGILEKAQLNNLEKFQLGEVKNYLESQLTPKALLQARILEDIRSERHRQDAKFGADRNLHPLLWIPILGEEVGEVNEAVNVAVWDKGDYDHYAEELVQVAAVAVAMLENIHTYRVPAFDMSPGKVLK